MKYIKKLIEDRYGHENECWRVVRINIALVDDYEENEEGQQIKTGEHFRAVVELKGWKDADAFQSGKPEVDKKTVVIENLEQEDIFSDVYNFIADKVLADGQFIGGEIIDT